MCNGKVARICLQNMIPSFTIVNCSNFNLRLLLLEDSFDSVQELIAIWILFLGTSYTFRGSYIVRTTSLRTSERYKHDWIWGNFQDILIYCIVKFFFRFCVLNMQWIFLCMHIRGFTKFEITVACGLKFHCHLRTLSLKFQFSWDSQQGRDRNTSILVLVFWNFKLKVLEYPRNCRLHATLILKVQKNPASAKYIVLSLASYWMLEIDSYPKQYLMQNQVVNTGWPL